MTNLIWYASLFFTVFFWLVLSVMEWHNSKQKYDVYKIKPKTGFIYIGYLSTAITFGGFFV